MTKLLRTMVLGSAITLVVFVPSRDAHAGGTGMEGLEGLQYVVAIGAVIGAGIVVADTTYTVYDCAHASRRDPPSTGWANGERWIATPQVLIGVMIGSGVVKESAESFATAAAWTAWPAALMAHGFYTHEASPYGDGWKTPVVTLGVVDAGLGVFDVGMMLSGKRPRDEYVIGELVGAVPQTIFGLAYAAKSDAPDARTGLLLTALPAALALHAIIELELPKAVDPAPPPDQYAKASVTALTPTFMVQGARGPVPGLGVGGAF